MTKADRAPDLTPFMPMIAYQRVWWSADGKRAYVIAGNRGETHVELVEIDAATGATRVVLEETAASHITFGAQHFERSVRTLSSGEVLWWSERSGWAHLYLYGTDGSVRTLTQGDWVVRKVVSVDEDARRVVFTAAGRLPGSDLYLQELASVSLDGGEITTITCDGLDHDVAPSWSGRFFVDVTSRYDVATVSVLRDREGAVVLDLSQADATRLHAAGWNPPERLVVKAADGITDIYCALYKPVGFDPAHKYPVLDIIYGGPQVTCAALRYPQSGGPMLGTGEEPIFAALGFAVVTVDGRGSTLREKAFQDACRTGDGAAFVDDHAAAIQQLAADRPWMDLDRVGIMGHSAGGWASTRALLKRPDVFSVAVSSCGSHDNFLSHTWWGEKFYGLPDDFDYASQSNAALAGQLEGKLLLIHGELDDNAVPHGTMRLVDALIKANKDFDLLIIPNAVHHDVMLNGYWVRRRWDYLIRHLMGAEPPLYRVADAIRVLPSV
jgi:dipeptidyl aminopeptidase/acylaminoacyl peptidase